MKCLYQYLSTMQMRVCEYCYADREPIQPIPTLSTYSFPLKWRQRRLGWRLRSSRFVAINHKQKAQKRHVHEKHLESMYSTHVPTYWAKTSWNVAAIAANSWAVPSPLNFSLSRFVSGCATNL